MNPDSPKPSREEIEPKITALILGELPESEVALVRWIISQDSELQKLHDRLKLTIELTRETISQPVETPTTPALEPLKLSNARREKLLAQLKTISPAEFKPRPSSTRRLIDLAAVLAILALLAAMLLPSLASSKSRAKLTGIANNVKQLELAKDMWVSENNKSPGDSVTMEDLAPYYKSQTPPVAGESYVLGKVGEPVVAELDADKAGKMRGLSRYPVMDGKVHVFSQSAQVARRVENAPSQDRAATFTDTSVSAVSGRQSIYTGASATISGWVAGDTEAYTPRSVEEPLALAGAPVAFEALVVTNNASSVFAWSVGPRSDQGNLELSDNNPIRYALSSDISKELSQVKDGGITYNLNAIEQNISPAENQFIASSPVNNSFYANSGVNAGDNLEFGTTRSWGSSDAPLSVGKNKDAARVEPAIINSLETPSNDRDGDFSRGALVAQGGTAPGSATTPKLKNAITLGPADYLGDTGASQQLAFGYSSSLRERSPKVANASSYEEAKDKLERMKHFASIVEMKLLSVQTDQRLPITAVVTPIEPAKPAPPVESKWRFITGLQPAPQSTARLKVVKNVTDISGLESRANDQSYDPNFLESEFEVMKSPDVLDRAIKSLDLQNEWSKDGKPLDLEKTRSLLRDRLKLSPVRNTTLVDVTAKGTTPDESARLANAVADAYGDQRKEAYDQMQNRGVLALKEEYGDQEKKIAAQAAEVERLRKLYHIPDTNNLNGEPTNFIPRKSTNAPIPQPEVQTRDNAFSTFSLNVSDVSFNLAAASLEQGHLPDPASIRSEEFVNAFDYHDPEATSASPVAFAWERARYPFAHNRDLLRFALKTAATGRQNGRSMNIVLLLDNSGSMERVDRVQIVRNALQVLGAQLQPQDKLSIVTFSRTPHLRADGVSGSQATDALKQAGELTPEGGTNLEEAMNLAYQAARRHFIAGGINRVVLLTDGAANLGTVDAEPLKQKVEFFRKQGIALDCFGIGWEGYNDDLLEALSRNGDGRYGFINTPEEAATKFAGQLTGALKIAASDVKVQVEFNPKRVTSYRQVGYAKHQLTKEQFRDNTVDAAEIAAQEAGNALYTIETKPDGEGPIATVRVRYKVPGTSDYREQEWSVPFTGASAAPTTPAMHLATVACAFSEWLALSPFAQPVTLDQLLQTFSGVPASYPADPRPQRLEWMLRQAKSLEGK